MLFPLKINETTVTYASQLQVENGTYYVTVVAYNGAMDPSMPVCSDGITIDQTPPLLSDVDIKATLIRDGMVKTTNGQLWFIDRRGFKKRFNSTDDCVYVFFSIENKEKANSCLQF